MSQSEHVFRRPRSVSSFHLASYDDAGVTGSKDELDGLFQISEVAGTMPNEPAKGAIATLPPEIWDQIIAYADLAALAAFASVNTAAYSLAMRYLYSSITLPKTQDASKLLITLSSPVAYDYTNLVRSLDIPVNESNCQNVNNALKYLKRLVILKLKISGQIGWPFTGTSLDLVQFHWEAMQEKGALTLRIEHEGGPTGLSDWLETQPNITKLKLVTHERIRVSSKALRKLVRASGPMFIVSNLVPGRPVDVVQTTPRSRDATAGMSALGESTGPLRHLKIVSRPELDHGALLVVIARFNPCLESIAFELCVKVPDMKVFLSKALRNLPNFPRLQSFTFCSRVQSDFKAQDEPYYKLLAERVQRRCPSIRRVCFPGVMATMIEPSVCKNICVMENGDL